MANNSVWTLSLILSLILLEGGLVCCLPDCMGMEQRGSFSCACSGNRGTADNFVLFGFFFPSSFSLPSPSLSSSCLMSLQTSGEKKRSGHAASNGFAGHINLPDLVQQSHSPAGTPTEALGRVSTHAQDMDSVPEVGGGGLLFLLCIAFKSSINISAP